MIKKYNLNLNKLAIIIAILIIIISLSYSFYIQPPLNVDAKGHQHIALNIMQGNGYWESTPPNIAFDPAIGRSGPLLEYILAGTYYIFGVHIWIIWIMHALMHGLTAWLIYNMCLVLFESNKEKIGIIAMTMFGFYPDLIESTAMLMTETSYIFLVILLLYLFIKYTKNQNYQTLIFFSVIAGLSFLAKSTIALSSIAFIIYFLKEKKYKEFILISIIVITVVSPWVIRNYIVFDKFIPSRIYGFYTLHNGNYHGASGENDIELLPEALKIKEEQGVFAVEDYSKQQFFNFIKQHPLEYLSLHFKKISIYFSWLRPTGHWTYLTNWQRLTTYVFSGIFSVLVFSLGITGIWHAFKKLKNNKIIKYLILFTILTPLPFIITLVETRYRYPIYPLLAIFGAYAVMTIWQNKKFKYFTIITGILLINSVFDLIINWSRFLDKIKF